MAYVSPNFKTKKALKEALANGEEVFIFWPGITPSVTPTEEYVEGPHYPEPHRWYGKVELLGNKVIRVIT